MHLTGLDFFLWAVSFLANLGLLFVLCYRRLGKSFPLFTALALLCVIRAVVMYFVLHHGTNGHHIAEGVFKSAARALRQAVAIDPRQSGVPSSKGTLTD